MNALTTFRFNDLAMRTLVDWKEPLFMAKDVCKILDLRDISTSLGRLQGDEKLRRILCVSGQNRNVWFVTEPGVYRLIFTSRKPEAETFKRWLAHEVLPKLRKTGSYSVNNYDNEMIGENMLLRRITSLQDELLQERKTVIDLLQQRAIKKHRAAPIPITPEEMKTIVEIYKANPNISLSEIARRVSRSKAAVSMLLRRHTNNQFDLFNN